MFKADYAKTQKRLAGAHAGGTILVLGTAPSLNQIDLATLEDRVTLACNGILRQRIRPTYLMISDRRVYVPELQAGHLAEYARTGNLLLSTTLFDTRIQCGGVPPQRVPRFKWWPWRVGVCSTPINWRTFAEPLCSFASAVGQMLQMAVILGAKRVGIVGIDMSMPKKGPMHCYRDTVALSHAAVQPDGTLGVHGTWARLKEAKMALDHMGIEVRNLSPVKSSPFGAVFGYYDYDKFLQETE